jgi:hypothetical protein
MGEPRAAGQATLTDAAPLTCENAGLASLTWRSAGTHNLFLGRHHARGIENNLHWQLDVTFREDSNREQGRNAASNLALVRKLALTLLKRHPVKESIACKRLCMLPWIPIFSKRSCGSQQNSRSWDAFALAQQPLSRMFQESGSKSHDFGYVVPA